MTSISFFAPMEPPTTTHQMKQVQDGRRGIWYRLVA